MKAFAIGLMATMAVVGSAHAATELDGHTLTTVIDYKNLGGVKTAKYQFFNGPNNENLVAVTDDVGNHRIDGYKLDGTELRIEMLNSNQGFDLDISNPKAIHKTFIYTIRPGQGGGDARPISVEAELNAVID